MYLLILLFLFSTFSETSGQPYEIEQVQLGKPERIGKTANETVSRLWFTDKGDLIVLRGGSANYVLEVFKGDSTKTQPQVDRIDTRLYAISRDASLIAQSIDKNIYVRDTFAKNNEKKTLDAEIIGMSFVGAGNASLAVLLSNGRLEIYNSNTLSLRNYTVIENFEKPYIRAGNASNYKFLFRIWGNDKYLFVADFDNYKLFRYELDKVGDFVKNENSELIIENTEFRGDFEKEFANEEGAVVFIDRKNEVIVWQPPENLKTLSSSQGEISDIEILSNNNNFFKKSNTPDSAPPDKISRFFSVGDFPGIYYLSKDNMPISFTFSEGELEKLKHIAIFEDKVAVANEQDVYLTKFEIKANQVSWIAWVTSISNEFWIGLLAILFTMYVAFASKGKDILQWFRLKFQPVKELSESDGYSLATPEIPPDLVTACQEGNCVLYVGSGISAGLGLPVWVEFVDSLVSWAKENEIIDSETALAYHEENKLGDGDSVADSVFSKTQEVGKLKNLHEFLEKTFLKRNPKNLSEVHTLLKKIKFSAVLTTNFDTFLEANFSERKPEIYTYQDTEELLSAVTKREFFILKLYGDLESPETLLVAPVQFGEAIYLHPSFSQCLETLFQSRTLFFIGASLEGIENYLKNISLRRSEIKHYALVHVKDDVWRARANSLRRRYGIEVLPFTTKGDFKEVEEVIANLVKVVDPASAKQAKPEDRGSRLQKVSLTNIGPFDELELKLDSDWNVLLGDNGVGKSTILRAIAVALAGKKAEPFASRLVKAGKKFASIKLETSSYTTYLTEIEVNSKTGECTVTSPTAPLLETEGWFAIGFPPLRFIGWKKIESPLADNQIKSRSMPEDLLPMIVGEPDPRMENLKQWIVTFDYERIRREEKKQGSGNRYSRLIDMLFDTINKMIEPVKVKYRGINPNNNQILIEIGDDGKIPLESVSQGMASLMGWIGILLQRFYEIYDRDEEPLKRYALVLMDEIDAHMHPSWQRIMISKLQKIFPNVQFIVTTHSPLIIGGMKASQVVRFARNESGKIEKLKILPDMTIGDTDQILTSNLFGLKSTLDVETLEKQERYDQLLVMSKRGEDDEQEFQELKQELLFRTVPSFNTYEGRHHLTLENAELLKKLGEQLKELDNPEADDMISRGEKLITDIKGGSKDDPDTI